MSETKEISTITTTTIVGSALTELTEYIKDAVPDTIRAVLKLNTGLQDGVSFKEGELVVKMKNSPDKVNFFISNKGELVVWANTTDANNYSINSNGDLEWTG